MEIKRIETWFKDCDFSYLSYDNVDEKVFPYLDKSIPFDFELQCGVSKFAIVPADLTIPYVIKIPFQGIGYDKYCFEPFDNANSTFPDDFCCSEAIIYKAAKQAGINKFFAKTRYLCSFRNVNFYVQERVDHIFKSSKGLLTPSNFNSLDAARRIINSSLSGVSQELYYHNKWIADAVEYFGEKQFKKLIDFIEGWYINDLHEGNIGYIKDRPVLFDYSGF